MCLANEKEGDFILSPASFYLHIEKIKAGAWYSETRLKVACVFPDECPFEADASPWKDLVGQKLWWSGTCPSYMGRLLGSEEVSSCLGQREGTGSSSEPLSVLAFRPLWSFDMVIGICRGLWFFFFQKKSEVEKGQLAKYYSLIAMRYGMEWVKSELLLYYS